MGLTITDQHLGLVSRIYDVVLDPGAWGDVLADISRATGAMHSNLIVSDFTQPEVKIGGASYDDSIEQTFREQYAASEISMAENLAKSPVRRFRSDEDLCDFGVHF